MKYGVTCGDTCMYAWYGGGDIVGFVPRGTCLPRGVFSNFVIAVPHGTWAGLFVDRPYVLYLGTRLSHTSVPVVGI